MNKVLDRNLELLKNFQPYVYNKLYSYMKGEYGRINALAERILLARQDDLVINLVVESKGKQYLLCDHEEPVNQAYAWIDSYVDPSNKADIVFGMGMGFHLEVLLTSFKNKQVIVVEPDMELFLQILQVRNMELIIKEAELYVDEDTEVILERTKALLWDTKNGGIQCQPFEVYSHMFEAQWYDLRSKFIKQVENFTVDIATRKRFGELWVYNNIRNAENIFGASNAEGLAGKFSGVPGILVSAGPSLQINIHLLNAIKDRCIIMAAGKAANIAEDFGITPHFMVGIDASEAEARIHKNVKSKDIYFIYSNQVATGSVNSYSGPRFLMNFPTDIYTANFLEYSHIESRFFYSGPSVANTCFDILFKMGCNPIILLGQDLAFTGGSNYAGEKPGSVVKEGQFQVENYILTKDIYNNDIYTQPSYIAMKNWFEAYFEKVRGQVEIINATEGGLNIEHARNDSLQNVLSTLCLDTDKIDEQLGRIHSENRFKEDIREKLSQYNEIVVSEIAKLMEYSKRQARLINLVKRGIYHPLKDKKSFDKVANEITAFTDKVMQSAIYRSILANLVEIEFYLIKVEVDRVVEQLSEYDEVKDLYVQALERQNAMLSEKLEMVKQYLN